MANADSITTTTEQWRPVVGFEKFYEVSSWGRVKSLTREVIQRNGNTYQLPGRILRPGIGTTGYKLVALTRDGKSHTRKVHRLVVDAFLGGLEKGQYTCHKDGDRLNNVVSNLRVDTPSSNAYDTIKHGNHFNAGKTHCPQGHLYNEKNTRWYRNMRYCRACKADRRAAKRAA